MRTRQVRTFRPPDPAAFRRQALHWAGRHTHCHYFTDNSVPYPHGGFPHLLAAGAAEVCPLAPGDAFGSVGRFLETRRDWLVGHFTYDLKNETEALTSRHPDRLAMPPAFFYVPQTLVFFEPGGEVTLHAFESPEAVYGQIVATQVPRPAPAPAVVLQPRTPRETYLRHVERIREHILDGDVYELNYCLEFFAEGVDIDPLAVYEALNARSPMPFSAFGKTEDQYLLCASPERFLRKTGTRLLSQPIKGTARRGATPAEDERLKRALQSDEKERAENMMIVDLVRNDLARSARTGTVRVEEMFGVYTFAQLHQMISTVSAELRPEVPPAEALRNAFPMGSMTGAPKIKAMELIDRYESARRGLYAGTAGFFTPGGDFDFNVVIRSILYNRSARYLSCQAGSAITYDARGESEYEECLLKAKAMREVLGGNAKF
ncbi:MAG TPA: anthranilate synthase component I family protein [Cytophagales bacterium]